MTRWAPSCKFAQFGCRWAPGVAHPAAVPAPVRPAVDECEAGDTTVGGGVMAVGGLL